MLTTLSRAFVDSLTDNVKGSLFETKNVTNAIKTVVQKPYTISDKKSQNQYPISDKNG